jgi:hypothetical protein
MGVAKDNNMKVNKFMDKGYRGCGSATMILMMTLRLILLLSVCAMGCAHTVRIESDPPGANIRMGRKVVGVTPADVKVMWVPFRSIPVAVDVPGRRRLVLDLSRDLTLWHLTLDVLTLRAGKLSGRVPRTTHRAQFVRHHGPMGTWVPDDVR